MKDIIDILLKHRGNLTTESVDASIPLPPASLQSILKKDLSIPGVFISNHKNAFTNQFYNNEWDTFQTISSYKLSKHLAEVARTVSASIYEMVTGDQMPSNIQVNETLVLNATSFRRKYWSYQLVSLQLESTLECYLVNANCSLFNWLLNGRSNLASEGVLQTYVGVSHGDGAYKALSLRTRHLLAMVSGETLDINKTGCINSDHNEVNSNFFKSKNEA